MRRSNIPGCGANGNVRGAAHRRMKEDIATVADLDSIFQEEGRGLYNYLLALSRRPEEAQDLLQTVFVKFIEQVRFGAVIRATAGNYLVRMARNEWVSAIRRSQREVPLEDERAERIPGPNGVGEMEALETGQLVNRIVAETVTDPLVPEIVRTVLRLRLWEDRKVGEICRVLKKPRSSVYVTLRTGLALLKERFHEAGLTLDDLDGQEFR